MWSLLPWNFVTKILYASFSHVCTYYKVQPYQLWFSHSIPSRYEVSIIALLLCIIIVFSVLYPQKSQFYTCVMEVMNELKICSLILTLSLQIYVPGALMSEAGYCPQQLWLDFLPQIWQLKWCQLGRVGVQFHDSAQGVHSPTARWWGCKDKIKQML